MEELGKTRHGLQNRNLLISIKVLMPFSSTRIDNDKHTEKINLTKLDIIRDIQHKDKHIIRAQGTSLLLLSS